jgi:hypothetical protein
MSSDTEEFENKRAELLEIAFRAFPQDSTFKGNNEIAEKIIQAFCDIEPPETTFTMDWSTIYKDGSGGINRKPGNIILNWKHFYQKSPEIVLSLGGISSPWLLPFAALYLWNTVWSGLKIDLSSDHAIALLTMWEHKNPKNRIPEDEAFIRTNKYLTEHNLRPLSADEFTKIVNQLEQMKCIELDNGMIWLRERVRKTY